MRFLRGEPLQHPLPVIIIQATIAVPMQAGDRHWMTSIFDALLVLEAWSGKRRGHGSAADLLLLILHEVFRCMGGGVNIPVQFPVQTLVPTKERLSLRRFAALMSRFAVR